MVSGIKYYVLSMLKKEKIKSFTDLQCWREAHKLVLIIYSMTKAFPDDEKFGLVNQMRRAAISTASNIAEGFSRRTKKDKNQFYTVALSSNTELQSQLMAARDLGYFSDKQKFSEAANQSVIVNKLVNGLLKSSKDIKYT